MKGQKPGLNNEIYFLTILGLQLQDQGLAGFLQATFAPGRDVVSSL